MGRRIALAYDECVRDSSKENAAILAGLKFLMANTINTSCCCSSSTTTEPNLDVGADASLGVRNTDRDSNRIKFVPSHPQGEPDTHFGCHLDVLAKDIQALRTDLQYQVRP